MDTLKPLFFFLNTVAKPTHRPHTDSFSGVGRPEYGNTYSIIIKSKLKSIDLISYRYCRRHTSSYDLRSRFVCCANGIRSPRFSKLEPNTIVLCPVRVIGIIRQTGYILGAVGGSGDGGVGEVLFVCDV